MGRVVRLYGMASVVGADMDDVEAGIEVDGETGWLVDGDEVEKYASCGKVDDNTNSLPVYLM